MMRRLSITLATAVVGLTLAVPGASAAVEIGDECSGTEAEGPYSLIPEARGSGGSLPLAASAGGVVTGWKVNSSSSESVIERMAVFRPTGPSTFQTIDVSAEETVRQGANAFSTRIPIQAGDRVGLVAVTIDSPLFCSATGNSDDKAWAFVGSVGAGSTHTFMTGIEIRVPLVAVIEPDKDGDGYGDETQDGCPQSAAFHTPCPTISLEAFPLALKRSVLLLVSASQESSVQVFGQVSWGVKRTGGASSSKTRKPGNGESGGMIVGLSGGTKALKPGEIARFNVKLPKSVKRHLAGLPTNKSVKGTITARTTDLTGRVVDRTVRITLKGRKRSGS